MMRNAKNNTPAQSDIERIVMRRVHVIRFLRIVLSLDTLAVLASVAALWGIGREVWVARVFANGPHDFLGHARYFVYAFDHTKLIVQALVLLALAGFVYIARETARAITAVSAPHLRLR